MLMLPWQISQLSHLIMAFSHQSWVEGQRMPGLRISVDSASEHSSRPTSFLKVPQSLHSIPTSPFNIEPAASYALVLSGSSDPAKVKDCPAAPGDSLGSEKALKLCGCLSKNMLQLLNQISWKLLSAPSDLILIHKTSPSTSPQLIFLPAFSSAPPSLLCLFQHTFILSS